MNLSSSENLQKKRERESEQLTDINIDLTNENEKKVDDPEDYCKVYLFLEKVVFKYNPGKKSTGYYCTIYHFDKEGNDTAQSFFIKCNDKLRKKLILMYKKWLKNGLDMQCNFLYDIVNKK